MAVIGVTGAAGFIGGALLPRLIAKGHTVRALDNFSGPLTVVHPDVPVERADLRDDAGLRILGESEVVLHLAAVSGVMACANDPVGSRAVNVDATRRVAEFCRTKGIPLALASSFAVVGIPDRLPITEATPPRPPHAYARQKAEAEDVVRSVSGPAGIPVGILRMSNVYGSYRVGDRTVAKGNVLNLFAQQAMDGTLHVNAPGTQRRDYIHLEDVLAHWEAAARFLTERADAPAPWTFNVASGETATVLELADRVSAEFHRSFPDRPPLRVEIVPNPRGDIEILHPDFSVDRSETERRLNVHCTHDLDASIREILRATAEARSLPADTGARNA
ncbi:MAG: NAD-dependent epimerase/dehydratase family protein [Thermoplasmata archaeon]